MSVVTGVVSRISDKSFGNKTFFSFALKGADGWFGSGVKRPPKEGTLVRFESRVNAKGYKEVDGVIEILEDGAIGPSPGVRDVSTSGSKGGSGGVGAAGAYWDRKEGRDVHNDQLRELGASRNTAISLIDLMLKNEAVKLPAVAKREEFIRTLLNRYTDILMGKDSDSKETSKEESKTVETPNSDPVDGDIWA